MLRPPLPLVRFADRTFPERSLAYCRTATPIVRPEWIVDSLEAGRVLPVGLLQRLLGWPLAPLSLS